MQYWADGRGLGCHDGRLDIRGAVAKGPGIVPTPPESGLSAGFPQEHDPEKLQTFRIKSCDRNMQEHDPEKLQTFRIRSCDRHSSARASSPDPGRLARRRAGSRSAADPPDPPTCRPCSALAPAAPAWQQLRPGLCTPPPDAGTSRHVCGRSLTRARRSSLRGGSAGISQSSASQSRGR